MRIHPVYTARPPVKHTMASKSAVNHVKHIVNEQGKPTETFVIGYTNLSDGINCVIPNERYQGTYSKSDGAIHWFADRDGFGNEDSSSGIRIYISLPEKYRFSVLMDLFFQVGHVSLIELTQKQFEEMDKAGFSKKMPQKLKRSEKNNEDRRIFIGLIEKSLCRANRILDILRDYQPRK